MLIKQNSILEFQNLKINRAIEEIMKLFRSLNKYLEINKPWKILKQDPKNSTATTAIYVSINALCIGTQLLYPIMPKKTQEISQILGLENFDILDERFDTLKPGIKLGEGKSPFPRI